MSTGNDGRDPQSGEDTGGQPAPGEAEGYAEFEPVPADEEQLALDEEEERLPWLENDDEDEDEGADTRRIIAFGLAGLIALAILIGLIWWFFRDTVDSQIVADGSTIAAPEEPYKTRPDDPGGKTFEGTGDSSFAVAEGQSTAARIAQGDAVPAPSIDREQAAAPGPVSDDTGVAVQVAAYSSRASAEEGWTRISGQYSVLGSYRHRVVEAEIDGNMVYRLQAVAQDRAAATSLCSQIKSAGGSCQVK